MRRMVGPRASRLVLPSLALILACGDDTGTSASDSAGSTSTSGTASTSTGATTTDPPTTGGSASGSTSTTGDEPVTPTSSTSASSTSTTSTTSTSTSSTTTSDTTTGEPVDPGGCVESVDGWCWTYPLPHGNTLHDVWPDGAGRVWVVGEGGTIMRHDGQGWQTRSASHVEGIRGVWGSAPDDVWAVGDYGLIVHFDGATWTEVESPTEKWLRAVWGSSAGDIWAGGDGGVLLHYDGAAWTLFDPGLPILDVLSLWGFGPDDVWAGTHGLGGVVIHWDGQAWSYRPVDELGSVTALWGRGPNDMYAAFNGGVVAAHWTGGPAWEPVEMPVPQPMSAVAGDDDEVWVGGFYDTHHLAGGDWAQVPELDHSDIHSLERVDDDILAVGARGVIGRKQAGGWQFEAGDPVTGVGRSFGSVWGRGDDDIWAGGAGIAHWDGDEWTFVDIGLGFHHVTSLAGADGILWAYVSGGDPYAYLWRHDGDAWSEVVKVPSNFSGGALWAADAGTLWIGGDHPDGDILRWDGQSFTFYEFPGLSFHVTEIAGLAADDIWAVGDYERLMHFDGEAWVTVHQAGQLSETLQGLAVVGPDDVWCAGDHGDLHHWDGVNWTDEDGTNWGFNDMWVEAPDSIWAVGGLQAGPGVIFHYDGAAWSRVVSGSGHPLISLWGTGTGAVWAVGSEHSALVHRR